MKKIGLVIIAAAGLLILFGLGLAARPTSGSAAIAETGKLSAAETSYDFGKIKMSDGKVSHIFTLKNTGANSVKVSKIFTSCMCTVAFIDGGAFRKGPFGMPGHGGAVPATNENIGSGEERRVEVVFDPAAHGPAGIGTIERSAYIQEKEGGKTELKIKALVTP